MTVTIGNRHVSPQDEGGTFCVVTQGGVKSSVPSVKKSKRRKGVRGQISSHDDRHQPRSPRRNMEGDGIHTITELPREFMMVLRLP